MNYKQSFGSKLNPDIFRSPEKIEKAISDFISYVKYRDMLTAYKRKSYEKIDFNEGFLGVEENYKQKFHKQAMSCISWEKWDKKAIDSGSIAKELIDVLNQKIDGKEINLINRSWGTLRDFKNKLSDPISRDDVNHALYKIYRSNGEKAERTAFNNAKEVFGTNYDVLAFMFYLKDPTRFLPLKPKFFNQCFEYLNINHRMGGRGKVTWDNYRKFLNIVGIIKDTILDSLIYNATLLDAHSFLWMILPDEKPENQNQFTKWRLKREREDAEQWYDVEQNEELEQIIYENKEPPSIDDTPMDPPETKPTVHGKVYKRNSSYKYKALKDADFKCEIDTEHPTFKRKKSKQNYTETHHLIPTQHQYDFQKRLDVPSNIISLCSVVIATISYIMVLI